MKTWLNKARAGSQPHHKPHLIPKEEKDEYQFNDEENYMTTYVVVPPDKGWGWVVVAAAFMYNLAIDGILYNFGLIYLDTLAKEFHTPKKEVALVMSLFVAVQQMLGPIASALTNRYGFQRVCIFGSLLTTACFGLSYFATSILYLCAIFGILGGVGSGMMYMACTLCVSFYFQRWRPLAVCLASCGSQIGAMTLGPVLQVIMDNYGWRYTMVFYGGLFAVCVFLGVLFRPLKPIKITKELDKDKDKGKDQDKNKIKDSTLDLLTPQNISSLMSLSYFASVNNLSHSGRTNRDFPTAAEIILGSDMSLSELPRSPSFLSTHLSTRGASLVTLTLDMVQPLWDMRSGSHTSMRIVVGQDMQDVQSYWRRPHATRRFYCARNLVCCGRAEEHVGVRPLYRDDIFFDGSMTGLPQGQLGGLGLNLAVTRMATKKDIDEEKSTQCLCCPEAVSRTLATMLDLQLFKSPTFLILLANCCLFQFAVSIPLIFLTDRASVQGMDSGTVNLFVPVISMSALVCKAALGVVTSIPRVSMILLYNIMLTVGGISILLIGSTSTAAPQLACCVVFGALLATFYGLRCVVAVQLLGLQNLTNAFGLILMFCGISTVAGPPFAGWFRELTASYDSIFWLSGSVVLLSALLMYPITWVSQRERRKTTFNEDLGS